MNILIPDSWLREYLKTNATPAEIKRYLSLCGPSVERLEKIQGEYVYDIEVTTNRVDSASVMGIAREAVAILPRFGKKATLKDSSHLAIKPFSHKENFPLKITVHDGLCSRIMAIILDNVQLKDSSTLIKKRLKQVGINSINNAVDMTNYVMVEIGQPTHVFDFDLVAKGEFIIRKARKGEKIIDLHGVSYTLNGGETVIDNGNGEIIDLPGIIGTKNSVVNNTTKRILFFMEANNPVQIRNTSMGLGIRTNAASLNEKGIDPELAQTALYRGVELLKKETDGQVSSSVFDYYPKPYKPKNISVSKQKAFQYLGSKLSDTEIKRILTSLAFTPHITPSTINATVPSFRTNDMHIPEDLIEELARIHGYHTIPEQLPEGDIPPVPQSSELILEKLLKTMLKGWGYTELYTYSFVSQKRAEQSGYPLTAHMSVANPLTEDTAYMRKSLLPSLLAVVEQNQNRKKELFLFELAHVYHLKKRKKLPEEQLTLAIANQQNFLSLKGLLEGLFDALKISDIHFVEEVHELLHDYQTAAIKKGTDTVGFIGTLSPNAEQKFGIIQKTFLAELNIEKLIPHVSDAKQYTPIAKHPAVVEDFAFKFPEKTYIGHVMQQIQNISNLITQVTLLEMYQDTTTFRVTFQHRSQNLSKKQIESVRKKILAKVSRIFDGKLKKQM